MILGKYLISLCPRFPQVLNENKGRIHFTAWVRKNKIISNWCLARCLDVVVAEQSCDCHTGTLITHLWEQKIVF